MRKLDFIFHVFLLFALLVMILFNFPTGMVFLAVAQFFVGIYQLISSAIRTFHISAFDKTIQKLILLYWGLCVAYVLGIGILYLNNVNHDYIGIFFFSAWAIAIYYCYITYLLAFPKYVKSHLDI